MRRLGSGLALAAVIVLLPLVPAGFNTQSPTRSWTVPARDGVVHAPARFAALGAVWDAPASPHAGAKVSVLRTGRWSRWHDLEAEDADGPDGGSRTAGTPLLWVGRGATAARLRFAGVVPRGARLILIDPGSDPSASRSGVAAAAAPSGVPIVTREAWGADESIRKCCPRPAGELKAAFVHHTASGNGYGPSDAAAVVRSIYAYHVHGRGWDDIGYNFLVDRYGRIFEGRAGGVDRPLVGAHAQGFNSGSVGVAMIGTYSGSHPPAAAYDALGDLLAWKLDLHYLDPLARVTMTSGGSPKYEGGMVVELPRISAHRDVGETGCPGGPLYSALPRIRADVARPTRGPRVFEPVATMSELTPNADGVADSGRVSARFSAPVDWRARVLDPGGAVVRELTGSGTAAVVDWDGVDGGGRPVLHGAYRVRIEGSNEHGATRPVDIPLAVRAWPDGSLLLGGGAGGGVGWVLESGRLRPLSGPRALESRQRWDDAIAIPDTVTGLYPHGAQAGFREGALVEAEDRVWLISGGARRPVSPEAFAALGFRREAVVRAEPWELAPHPAGPAVSAVGLRPEGVALRGRLVPQAWKLSGIAWTFLSTSVRDSWGVREVDLVGPADAEIAASGALRPIGFRDGTLVRGRSGPAVYVVSGGMRRPIPSASHFEDLGYRWESVREVSEAELALHAEGPPV